MRRLQWIVVTAALLSIACGGGQSSSPTAPSTPAPAPPAPAPPGLRILLAGQSNAAFLSTAMPEAVAVISVQSIDRFLSWETFADAARSEVFSAFVWWHGATDGNMAASEYAEKLRRVIEIARSGNPGLPVRIVELPDLPDRVSVREAQRQVATDPNVEMIPTADLQIADAAGHFVQTAYPIVRERIHRSLGK